METEPLSSLCTKPDVVPTLEKPGKKKINETSSGSLFTTNHIRSFRKGQKTQLGHIPPLHSTLTPSPDVTPSLFSLLADPSVPVLTPHTAAEAYQISGYFGTALVSVYLLNTLFRCQLPQFPSQSQPIVPVSNHQPPIYTIKSELLPLLVYF